MSGASELAIRPDNGIQASWYSVHINGHSAIVTIGDNIGCYGAGAQDLLREIEGAERIEFVINSIGGDSAAAWEIFDRVLGRVTEATILQHCCSAAVTIALSAKKVRIERGARLMVHQAREWGLFHLDDLELVARRLGKLAQRQRAALMLRSGKPEHVVKAWLERDTWFTADSAQSAGLVDEIFSMPEASAQREALRKESLAGRTALPAPGARPGPTPGEKLFSDFLRALGTIEVRDIPRFGRTLQAWFSSNVREHK